MSSFEQLNFLKIKKFITEYRELGNVNMSLIQSISINDVIDLISEKRFNVYDVMFLRNFWPALNVGDVMNKLIKEIDPTTRREEKVMVIPRVHDFHLKINTLKRYKSSLSIKTLINAEAIYMTRGDIEYDRNYVQLIPNIVVRHKDEIILLRKIEKEDRMINTIGCPGGHIDKPSKDGVSLFQEFIDGAYRELEEELGINISDTEFIKVIDIIDPVLNPLSVSYYHLGITVFIRLNDDADIKNMEPNKHEIIKINCREPIDTAIANKIEFWCNESLLHAGLEDYI